MLLFCTTLTQFPDNTLTFFRYAPLTFKAKSHRLLWAVPQTIITFLQTEAQFPLQESDGANKLQHRAERLFDNGVNDWKCCWLWWDGAIWMNHMSRRFLGFLGFFFMSFGQIMWTRNTFPNLITTRFNYKIVFHLMQDILFVAREQHTSWTITDAGVRTLAVWVWTVIILFTERSLVHIQCVSAAALQHQHVCLTQDIKAVSQSKRLWSVGLFGTKSCGAHQVRATTTATN